MNTVIDVEMLGKKYTIRHEGKDSYIALRDVLSAKAKNSLQWFSNRSRSVGSNKPSKEDFWALKEISFKVRSGERVGIIGRNGAGKSTLLKLLSRITEPTEGSIRLKGRVSSLLEVGTGFHPELTGRENIFLNGAILGLSRVDIVKKFDEIVEFAEVNLFLDTPVKRYSSGMQLRLAFAVAAHLEPEILLVDEVLAVGDASFQKKCLGKMDEVAGQGRTVLFVSHNMASIAKLCQHAIWLDQGRIKYIGEVRTTIQSYLASNETSNSGEVVFDKDDKKEAAFVSVFIQNDNEEITTNFDVYSSIKVEITFSNTRRISDLRIDLVVYSYDGTMIFATTSQDYGLVEGVSEPGYHSVQVSIPGQLLAPGDYYISLGLCEVSVKNYDLAENVFRFRIEGSPFNMSRMVNGFLVYPFEWKLISSEKP